MIPGANISSDRRNFFMSSAQLEALEKKEEQEQDPIRQKMGTPLRASGRILDFVLVDPHTAVLALGSHQARVADLQKHSCRPGLVKHEGPVTAVAVLGKSFKVNGSRIALSASWDKRIRVWAVDRPQHILAELVGHTDFVKCLVAHPTLPLVYSGSADRSIMIWRLPQDTSDLNGEIAPSKIIKGQHTGQVYTLCTDSVGEVLYSAGSDASVRAWNAQTGAQLEVAWGEDGVWCIPRGEHKTNIFDIKATENGLWTASADKTAIGWDLDTGRPDLVLEHTNPVNAVLPVPQVGAVITATTDGILHVWSTAGGSAEKTCEIHAHTDGVTSLGMLGRWFYSAGLDNTLRTWDISDVVKFRGAEYIPADLKQQLQLQQQQQQKKESMLTAEEELELAALMSDDDDDF
ncbi:hypothetical protein GGI07_004522 [Coemansia sp. Benny D115]|nr:hypothetical protein GGI07_004522 [Coemansia sp. Benny D115]